MLLSGCRHNRIKLRGIKVGRLLAPLVPIQLLALLYSLQGCRFADVIALIAVYKQ